MKYQKYKSKLFGRCGIMKISLFVQFVSYISITLFIFKTYLLKKDSYIKWVEKRIK